MEKGQGVLNFIRLPVTYTEVQTELKKIVLDLGKVVNK